MMPNDFQNPFLIPELFHCLLECLVASLPQRPEPSKLELRTLAALARTCHAFSEPSLNRLWRCLNSLLPLVRCFSDVVDGRRVKTPPTPLEWLIIHRYSPRIQELTLGNEPLSLHFLQRTGLALPNLRVFRLKYSPIRKFFFHPTAFLWPLFSSQIVALEVEVSIMDDQNYLACLESYFPFLFVGLKSIKLNFPNTQSPGSVSGYLLQAICGNIDWQHVSLSPPIDYVVLKYLGMSTTLKTASLKLAPQASRPDETCFGAQDIPFRNVTDLTLTLGNSLDFATCLLRPRDQAFHSFKVTLYAVAFATEVSALLAELASPQRIHSLRSLTINHIPCLFMTSIDILEMPVDQHLTCETLRPLVSFVYLRTLVLHFDNSMSMNDEEFAGLVCNWPLLEVLKLMWKHEEHPVASITLNGLLSLLASCQRLRKIGLTLDARVVPVGEYPLSDVFNPSITAPLTVCDSPLHHPDLVAKFLMKHLPSMRSVHLMWSLHFYESYSRSWLQVNEHINNRQGSRFAVFKHLWHCLGRSDDGGGSRVDVYPPGDDD